MTPAMESEVAATATAAAAADVPSADADASKLARRVERFGRIAPITEEEAAEKMAKRKAKFGLTDQVLHKPTRTLVHATIARAVSWLDLTTNYLLGSRVKAN